MRGLRAQGIDVLTTSEAGKRRTPDDQQLAFATEQGRVIFTSDVKDFNRLHNEWVRSNRHHAGIVLLHNQRTSTGAQTRAFLRLMAEHTSETMRDRVEFLDNWVE
ncbi:MAG: DUF5615 family PIN-like protein [Chloroflexi bacterium]|nr:DUF5615 family PIN-like protein [Chloroflexota bacterium]